MSKETTELKKKLQAVFNKWVRTRDSYYIDGVLLGECISCGTLVRPNSSNWQAGHFYSVGAYPNLRFVPENVHGQCFRCNIAKEGNKQGYGQGLIKRYGDYFLDKLEIMKNNQSKLGAGDLRFLIQYYEKQTESLLKKLSEDRKRQRGL